MALSKTLPDVFKMIAPNRYVIAEEFGEWEDSHRSNK